jgi:hypothetical protein
VSASTKDLQIRKEFKNIELKVREYEEEKNMKLNEEKKLILDQPDTVTTEGTVEHVAGVDPLAQPLVETPQGLPKQDILLNEDPVDGVEIIVNE